MPSRQNPVSTWSAYYASMLDKPHHPLYSKLDPYLKPGQKALELGAGVGHGVAHLLELGLEVTAIDAEPEAVEILRRRASQATLIEGRFEEMALIDDGYDVIVAGFSLFFLTETQFEGFWPRLVGALKPGGLFAGEFLGLNDDWATDGYLAHSEVQVLKLLESFEILYYEEADRDGATADGAPKHWHVYHVVARKL